MLVATCHQFDIHSPDMEASSPEGPESQEFAPTNRNEFVRSLATGLKVLECFTPEEPRLTLTDVARRAAVTRATARRMLLTLVKLGYANATDRHFELTPRVLALGYGYWSGKSWNELLQPSLSALSEKLGQSCSAAVLVGDGVLYVSRVHTRNIMRIELGIGTKLPAFATSMGRVLLADLPREEMIGRISEFDRPRFTKYTQTDPQQLRETLERVKRDGYALVDQELEYGLRSMAVPVRAKDGRAVMSVNTSMNPSEERPENAIARALPHLQQCAESIEHLIHALGKDADRPAMNFT